MNIVPQIDTWPFCIRGVQTLPGKLLVLAAFGVELWTLRMSHWPALLAPLALIVLVPAWRGRVVPAGTLVWIFLYVAPSLPWAPLVTVAARDGLGSLAAAFWLQRAMVALCLALFACASVAVGRSPRGWAARHPVTTLLLSCALLLAAALAVPAGRAQVLLWAFLVTFTAYLWFAAYALAEGAGGASAATLQLGGFTPFWYGAFPTSIPFPKPGRHLRRIEVTTPLEAAITQLKAVKLLAWTILLKIAAILVLAAALGAPFARLDRGLHRLGWRWTSLGIPALSQCLAHSVAGHPDPWWLCWASLLVEFWLNVVNLAIWGNLIVAACRMAGFKALRNTYKPFYARSISEFFNRYYFYFKELLVDLFFYPTYLRCWKRHKQGRLLFATFVAAGVGNAIFHFLRDLDFIADRGFWRALESFQVYGFYCLVLSAGIGCSQILTNRAARRGRLAQRGSLEMPPAERASAAANRSHYAGRATARSASFAGATRVRSGVSTAAGWRRGLAPVRVALFFCVLSVFDDPGQRLYPLHAHLRFLLNLLPMRLR